MVTILRRLGLAVVATVAVAGVAFAQGALAPIGVQLHDNNGNPCSGCLLVTFAAGTSTPLATFADAGLVTSNGTSVTLDSAGRASVFLDSRLAYLLTLRTPTGTDIWTRDGITGPLSGVISAQGADTRGIQVSRSSADAGISIASVGGSGKTYGLVSDTAGGFTIRDDSDGTPNITISGNNITATQTGTFSIPSGLFSIGGFGTHSASAGGTGGNVWSVRNTSAGTGNYGGLLVGNDVAANALAVWSMSSTYTTTGLYTANGAVVESTRPGGLSLAASDAAGAIRFYTGGSTERARIGSAGGFGVGVSSLTHDMNLRSTADDLAGGLKIDRSDGSYLILNVNDANAGSVIQAGDGGGYEALKLQEAGGGVAVGGGTAFLSVITGTSSWDPGSMINGAMQSTTVTVTGVQTTSPCIAGFFPNLTGTPINGQSLSAYYDSANTVRVVMVNTSGSTNDPSTATVRVTCFTY